MSLSIQMPNPTLKADRPEAFSFSSGVFITLSPHLAWGGGLAPR
jgi:hypothetical protein